MVTSQNYYVSCSIYQYSKFLAVHVTAAGSSTVHTFNIHDSVCLQSRPFVLSDLAPCHDLSHLVVLLTVSCLVLSYSVCVVQ